MSVSADEVSDGVHAVGEDGQAGWSILVPEGVWSASRFLLTDAALAIRTTQLPAPMVVDLADIVGVDQLDPVADVSPELELELELASGAAVRVRVPEAFVDDLIDALRRSRDAAPEPRALQPPPPAARSNSRSALQAEIAALRAYIDDFGVAEREVLAEDLETLRAHRAEALADLRAATSERRAEEVALVRIRRDVVLQDAGIYRPRHPAEGNPNLAERLVEVHDRIDEIVRSGTAVSATDDWTVNGSRSEGRKVVDELAALLLRTYNAEADLLVQTLVPEGVDAAIERLAVTRATIERLGVSMRIEISPELHQLRSDELTLAADHLVAERDERRRLLAVSSDGHDHIVVTSNVGSFGPGVVRIGTTSARDAVSALAAVDSAPLPFPSDLHALVPAEDAARLLGRLRERFADERCDLDDPDTEYFRVDPTEVRDALIDLGATVTTFAVSTAAEAWRRSEVTRRGRDDAA